jgi:dihydropteroate synthase
MTSAQSLLAERFPGRSVRWQLRTRELPLGARPLVMGIVNVTPDSFSDGGAFFDPGAAIAQGLELAAAGADLLDVGGESTRPYSRPVSTDEELRRVMPVIEVLCSQTSLPVSIDTSKAAVARAALAAGAEIINDVTALSGDPAMVAAARETGAAVVAMHMQGTPQTMQDNPQYADVVAEVHDFLRPRRDALIAAGIASERIALDPGIGFGKTHAHNLALVAGCWRFHDLGCPLLVGHSRKGFIAKVLGRTASGWTTPSVGTAVRADDASAALEPASAVQSEMAFGTIGVACALASQGVQIVRVHDVAAVRAALILFAAAGGIAAR